MRHTHILPGHATDGCLACGRGIREPAPIHEHTTTRHCSQCRGDINEDGHHCAGGPDEPVEHAAMLARRDAYARDLSTIREKAIAERRQRRLRNAALLVLLLALLALGAITAYNITVIWLNHSPLTVAPAGE